MVAVFLPFIGNVGVDNVEQLGDTLMVVSKDCHSPTYAALQSDLERWSKFYIQRHGSKLSSVYKIFWDNRPLYACETKPNDNYVLPKPDEKTEVKPDEKEYFWHIEKMSDGCYQVFNMKQNCKLLFGEEPGCWQSSYTERDRWGLFFWTTKQVDLTGKRRPSFAFSRDLSEPVLDENKLRWKLEKK